MTDSTENIRRAMVHEINSNLPPEVEQRYLELIEKYGTDNVFTTETVQEHFEIVGFMAPFVVARRKSDNARGTLMFSHDPRFYFDFQPT